MSNVLLVDTNVSSGPIYQFLIQEGHNVTVVGGNPNDALAKSVENYIQLDYSDIKKTRELIEDRNIDYIVPGCNDHSYMVCAEINQDGHFPGIDPIETAEIINNKEKFRSFAARHNLSTPKVLSEHEIGNRWPVIVKPVDAFSGRGVTVIREDNRQELNTALELARQASRTGGCIVEDYVEGQLHSHTAFIENGQIIADHIVEEHGTANPFVVDTSRVTFDFPNAVLERIRNEIHTVATELRLKNGLIHTQFISDGDSFWLIEITRRCPGDLYSQLIELSTGFNYVENYIRPFLGLTLKINKKDHTRCVMRHTLTQPLEFTLGSLSFSQSLNIIRFVPLSLTGDKLGASPNGRVGILFIEEPNDRELNKVFRKTLERKLYTIF